MPTDPDLPIRLAAFRAVEALRRRFGDEVPWSAIEAGFTHEGQQLYLATKARGIFRPRQMSGGALSVKTILPRAGRTTRYNDRGSRDAGILEYCFQGDDPDSRDNRLLEWCRVNDAPLIYLYPTDVGVYALLWPVYVGAMDRAGLRATLLTDDQATVPLDEKLVVRDEKFIPIARSYRTVAARARLHQAAFSARVLRAYAERCAICGLPRLHNPRGSLVEAAHIVPDRDEQGHPDICNGLALCVLHHRAFDADLLGVRPDNVVVISDRLMAAQDGPVLEHGLKQFQGQKLRLPTRSEDHPGQFFLKTRWDSFRAAS